MPLISRLLAGWITRRPILLAAAGLVIALTAAGIIRSRNAFDSEILNLLPAENPAVRGLKIYNSEFTQNRELAFLLSWTSPPDDPEQIRAQFVEELRKEPWVARILDRPPLEASAGSGAFAVVLPPLLLNLPPAAFREALESLAPDSLRARLSRLAAQAAAGSPRARFELQSDPLGLAARAARPVAETASISDTFELISPDRSALLVPVITRQSDDSSESCRATMADVHAFLDRIRAGLGPDAPAIGVTGRAAYVAEISGAMQSDITWTSIVSLLCVTALFWLGFRQFLPLAGIAALLALTALVTMAAGTLLFDQLNILAISFCSILFGLGDDFSLLLCQRYFQARKSGADREHAIGESIRHNMPGILWVAVTTGIGFLALCFSGSRGFAQLGVLVAIGILLCAVFMPVFLFLFVRHDAERSAETGPARTLAGWCLRAPARILRPAAVIFGILAIISLLPWAPLGFDISPASLEPKNIPAARTLSAMMKNFPGTFEPVMIVLPDPGRPQLERLDAALRELKAAGLAVSTSSPSALVLDPDRAEENRRTLRNWDPRPLRGAVNDAAESLGLPPELFTPVLRVLEDAAAPGQHASNWSGHLPESSPWWFLIDRMVAPQSGAAIAYLKLPAGITPEQREIVRATINRELPGALVTGWSQALASLIPWAQRELVVFGGMVTVLVLGILAFVYRDGRLWAIHVVSLAAAAAGTVATLKLLQMPVNLLNVLAFPLMLGVGVDYGTHVILALRETGDRLVNLAGVLKPITLSGLTTATGFGSLMLAQNPALSGLGAICAIGVTWCLVASLVLVAPAAAWHSHRKSGPR